MSNPYILNPFFPITSKTARSIRPRTSTEAFDYVFYDSIHNKLGVPECSVNLGVISRSRPGLQRIKRITIPFRLSHHRSFGTPYSKQPWKKNFIENSPLDFAILSIVQQKIGRSREDKFPKLWECKDIATGSGMKGGRLRPTYNGLGHPYSCYFCNSNIEFGDLDTSISNVAPWSDNTFNLAFLLPWCGNGWFELSWVEPSPEEWSWLGT